MQACRSPGCWLSGEGISGAGSWRGSTRSSACEQYMLTGTALGQHVLSFILAKDQMHST